MRIFFCYTFWVKVLISPKYFVCLHKSLHLFETYCAKLSLVFFFTLQKLRDLAIVCHTTELGRGMGLFLVWCHGLICIVLSRCKHACKEVCDVKQGIDPNPLLARSCDRSRSDFVNFSARKRSIFGLKRSKMAQCVSNRYKDLFRLELHAARHKVLYERVRLIFRLL